MDKQIIQVINENSFSRLYRNMKDKTVGILTAYRKINSGKENQKKQAELKADLRRLGLGFNEIDGYYPEEDGENTEIIHERSLVVYSNQDKEWMKNQMVKLGIKYDQDTIIVVDKNNGAYLIGATGADPDFPPYHEENIGQFTASKIEDIYSRMGKDTFVFTRVMPESMTGAIAQKHSSINFLESDSLKDFEDKLLKRYKTIIGENKMNTREMAEFFEAELEKIEEKQPVEQDEINEEVAYQYHTTAPIDEMADVGFGVEVHNEDDNSPNADQLKFAHFHWGGVHFKFSRNLPKNATQLKNMIAFKRELNKLDDHELNKLAKILKSKPPINKFGKYNNVYEKALDYWMTFNEREIDYIDIEEKSEELEKDKNESLISEDKKDKLKKIADEVYKEIERLYDNDPDLMEYVRVESYNKKYDDGSDMYVIEVRAEQTYEGMVNLADKLDKIVRKYDKDAYFDQVDGGVMEAVLDLDKNESYSKINEEVEDENDELALALQDYLINSEGENEEDIHIKNTYGNEYETGMGYQAYLVFSSYEEAFNAAVESELNLLDDIGISSIQWQYMPYPIEHYLDEEWFRQAWEEMNQSYIEDIIYEGGGRFHDELVERGIDPEKYGYNEETDEFEDEEGAKEAFADSMMADIEDDLIGEYKFQLGEENFEYAIKEAGADLDEIANDIVETDGPANALAGYDGKEIEWEYEGHTYYMYRTN